MERGIPEALAIQHGGTIPGDPQVVVPLATQVHHRDKRRWARLLDESQWLAVSRQAHRQIEDSLEWARANGYLRDF